MNEERMDVLESRLLELELEVAELKRERVARPRPAAPRRPVVAATPSMTAAPAPVAATIGRAEPRFERPERPKLTIEDVLSPRNLAIAGAIAVLAGLVFLVSYGISNGWISEEARVIGAFVFSGLLAGLGVYLREVRQLAAPAEALAALGLAGFFVSLVAATRLYDLIGPVPALIASAGIGLLGLGIGLAWRNEVISTCVLGGSLLAPLMVGAAYDPSLLAFLIPVFAAAVAAAIVRPWKAVFPVTATLFLASLLAAVADADQGSTVAAYALSLVTAVLVVAGSIGRTLWKRTLSADVETLVFGIFFSAVTALGTFLVTGAEHPLIECVNEGSGCSTNLTSGAAIWLISTSAIAAGIWWLARARDQLALSVTAFALGSTSLAAALGFLFDGSPLLTLAWSVEAACLIGLGRVQWQRLVGLAVLAAAIVSALTQVPIEVLGNGTETLLRDLGILAPVLLPLGLLAWREESELGGVGAVLAVAFATYMAVILCGSVAAPDSVLILLPVCLATTLPVCLTHRLRGQACAGIFGMAAVGFALATALPWDALVNGVPSAAEAILAAAMLIGSTAAIAWFGPEEWRPAARWSAVGVAIYVVSVLIVDRFQSSVEIDGELSTRSQGQVIVSSLWALTGLGLVVAGLLRQRVNWRKAGLVLLVLALAKISFYDLASLSTAGRTISFILVGLVLLAAAFAYQWMNRREIA